MDDEVITAAGETASADCPSSEESASLPTEASDSWADVDIDGLDVMPLSLGAYDGVKLGLCSGADEVGIDEVGLAVVGWLDVLGAADDDPADVGLSDRIIVGALVCIIVC